MAQRLVRRLCPHCKTKAPASPAFKAFAGRFGIAAKTEPHAAACARCRGQGFNGRIALAEGLWADDDFLALIGRGAGIDILKSHARTRGFRTMTEAGLNHVTSFETTFEEVLGISDD